MQLGVAAGGSKKQQLLDLATCSLQLWEAKRLMRCNTHMPARARGLITPTHEAVARVILRLDVTANSSSGSSSGSRHSSRVEAAEVNRRYKELARAVHPDKVPKDLQGVEGVRRSLKASRCCKLRGMCFSAAASRAVRDLAALVRSGREYSMVCVLCSLSGSY
jgi:hypothetical protein